MDGGAAANMGGPAISIRTHGPQENEGKKNVIRGQV
jgi:hypothetical protein